MVGVHPVVDEDQFRIGFRFVPQAILCHSPGRFKRNLLAADAVQTGAGAKIPVKLERRFPLLEFIYLFVRLFQKVIRRFRRHVTLESSPDLIRLAENGFSRLLGSQLYCRNCCPLCLVYIFGLSFTPVVPGLAFLVRFVAGELPAAVQGLA